jgi:hypothetical protein
MAHEVTLSITGSLDDSAALQALLAADPDLRGQVRRHVTPAPEGTLGGGVPDLLMALGSSGGIATAVASVVVVWLRQRAGSVSVRIKRHDGSELEIKAERVRALDSDGLRTQVNQLAALLSADTDAPPDDA